MTAVESGITIRRSESTVVCGMYVPRSAICASAPESSCQTCRSSGSAAHTVPTVMMPCSSSTTTATQLASRRIHSTCSREDVGCTGTTSAPTAHRAWLNTVHS